MSRFDRNCRRLRLRRRVLLGVWLIAGSAILVRAGKLQLLEAASWREMAAEQHRMSATVPATRGSILDRDGTPLAVSRETWMVSVDPQHVHDPDQLRRLLREELQLSSEWARKAVDPSREWVQLPGRYEPSARESLQGVPGIYLKRLLRRDYPHGELARGILGLVQEGAGRGGIEQAFDSILTGTPGRQVMARDASGNPIPGQVYEVAPPHPGGDVRLTLDLDLQEIAHQALSEAVEETGARGGDLIVTDPKTGEILALVSMTDGRYDALSAINTPYEPGSTLKPFTVAGVLKYGKGSLDDTVDAEGGSWRINQRTLTDTHEEELITLGDALRVSSNIGVAKAALPLTRREQYENLRDFGFGVPTGLPIPGEVGGLLRRPDRWSALSPQSLAIGYEVSVTPLQMAMAYGALANGGFLMEPRILRAVRASEEPEVDVSSRVIRQVVDAGIAQEIGGVLVSVVDDGTGTRAQLETFQVAGKSGTARAYGADGYERGRYFASFAGYFPAEDPQLVVFVKLDLDSNVYYGGATAAPVTRATMEAALAARQSPLDRRALVRSQLASRIPDATGTVRRGNARFATLPMPVDPGRPSPGRSGDGPILVPDVTGLPVRAAVRRLHEHGLRVRWDGGPIEGLLPEPGTPVARGDTIRLVPARGDR